MPTLEDYDSGMRREVAASMLEYNFFENLQPPNLLLEKPWIGIPQTNDPPLYYLFVAIPLWILRGADVTVQLYVARWVSFGMFLGTLWVGYLISVALFPRHKTLHMLLPGMIALTPAFADLMTAVNNDVGATLAFSIFLWAGTKFMQSKISLTRVGLVLVAAGVCFFTKNTVMLAVPAAVLLFLFKLTTFQPWRRWALLGLFVLAVGGGIYLFSWGDAAYWYRGAVSAQQNQPTQVQASEGNPALMIQTAPEDKRALSVNQPLTEAMVSALIGQTYTLGGWIWASEMLEIRLPTLTIDGALSFQKVQVSPTPTFYAISGNVPESARQISIVLAPLESPLEHSVTVFFDDIVLAQGSYPLSRTPTFAPDNTSGTWGSKDFLNYVRNSTMEQSWLTFKPTLLFRFQGQNIPVYALPAMQDIRLTGPYYRGTILNLFESYWARFGWNHVELPFGFYLIFGAFTLVGGIGTVMTLPKFKTQDQHIFLLLVWLAICAILIWIAAVARQSLPFWETSPIFTPSARYAYPVIFPTTLLFAVGWYLLLIRVKTRWKIAYLPIAILGFLDITSLIVISHFYQLFA
ncbi:MAG TPA: hypothetical protein PK530_00145 [Anaerolineales bacterium]|nr:hypothetical protein [Anaerolineales bacterium]